MFVLSNNIIERREVSVLGGANYCQFRISEQNKCREKRNVEGIIGTASAYCCTLQKSTLPNVIIIIFYVGVHLPGKMATRRWRREPVWIGVTNEFNEDAEGNEIILLNNVTSIKRISQRSREKKKTDFFFRLTSCASLAVRRQAHSQCLEAM